MNIPKNNRGVILLIALAFLALFTTIAVLYIASTVSDFSVAKQSINSSKAFFLAEAGINKALYELRKPGNWSWSGEGPLPIDWPDGSGSVKGEYKVEVYPSALNKIVKSTGYFPHSSGAHVQRSVEVVITPPSPLPSWFFDNVIFAGGDMDISKPGQIIGGIRYGGEGGNPADYTAEPFPTLNFETLRAMAVSQVSPSTGKSNLYTQADLEAKRPFPTSFYFVAPDPNIPGDLGTPNVVYVEGNLEVKGNTTIYGFYVVAGDVITDPTDSANSQISGTSSIVGCVYTLGDFSINGGGNALNVNGGVWCRDNFSQGGNGKLQYKSEYMLAIETMGNLDTKAAIKHGSWKEI